MHVAIAGGGLAGLTCAKVLVEARHQVTLFEGMPFLGGRASTYRDDDGDWVEQGLHLFLGTYSEFLQVLEDIGQRPDDILFWMKELRVQDPEGPKARYGINPLKAPLRTALAAAGQNRFLGPRDKLSLLPLAAPGLLPLALLERAFDDMTVVEWWRKARGSEAVLERVLRPFCRGIQFTDADQFSAYNFLTWVHHAARALPDAFAGGYVGARDDTIFRPFGRYLWQRGARIHTRQKLSGVRFSTLDPARARQVEALELEGGDSMTADAYVLAVPVWAVVPLLPEELFADPFFGALRDLPVAPAISVQLWFSEQVVDTSCFTLVGRSLTPVYQDQSTNAYPHEDGSRLSVIVAPADGLLAHSDEELVKLTLASLRRVQPRIRKDLLQKSVVLKHTQHLVRPLPGVMRRRPDQATPVGNLFFAGDWTQQPYLGSQEGAVRSGKACAEKLLERFEGKEADDTRAPTTGTYRGRAP